MEVGTKAKGVGAEQEAVLTAGQNTPLNFKGNQQDSRAFLSQNPIETPPITCTTARKSLLAPGREFKAIAWLNLSFQPQIWNLKSHALIRKVFA